MTDSAQNKQNARQHSSGQQTHVTDHFSIITTLVTGFGLALVFGWMAERFLKTPALVGFIIAGVAVSAFPWLPNVDPAVTEQFAEIGVMLLMFGVGLHFSIADLVKVKGVAVTGAVIQMSVSALAGSAVAMLAWDWALPLAVVFGMTLSCASTVVVTKALELRHLTSDMSGQVAIGWLIVQDLVTVFIMVCLPLMAQTMTGEGALDMKAVVVSLSKTLLGLVVFVAGMLIVGRRVFPWILKNVAMSGSRELFTLCVLAIAIGIAYGAGAIFNVSFALGAFFAGMVMRESRFAHRAAKNSLPLQDAFAVLFFVSVGLMLDWHVFINEPWAVLSVMLVIMCVTSTLGAFLVVALGWPLDTALILGACLSQIGEFSFILCGQGISLGLASSQTMSLIVAASIMTIAFNPLMFALIPSIRHFLVTHSKWLRHAAMREAPMSTLPPQTPRRMLTGHVIMASMSDVVQVIFEKLEKENVPVVCFASPSDPVPEVDSEHNKAYLVGDPTDPMMLVKAHIMSAALLVLPSADLILNRRIMEAARQLKPDLNILIRVVRTEDVDTIETDEHTRVICDVSVATDALTAEIRSFYVGKPEEEEEDDAEEPLPRPEERGRDDEEKGPGLAAEMMAGLKEKASRVHMPSVHMPKVKLPSVKLPEVRMPEMKMPDVKLPEMPSGEKIKAGLARLSDMPKPHLPSAERLRKAASEIRLPRVKMPSLRRRGSENSVKSEEAEPSADSPKTVKEKADE